MKRIFISSTFIDMQHERDLFHKAILPAINKIAKDYGEEVSVCDLRWGVNTNALDSVESGQKVLSVCLDEIDRCDETEGTPYFIVLLGNRYGWAPEWSLVKSVADRKQFALEERARSVTELEIAYGALRDHNHLARTLFYFRDIENEKIPLTSRYAVDGEDEDERLLNETRLFHLKEWIRAEAGERVKTYHATLENAGIPERETLSGLEDFVRMVTKDILTMMEQDWQSYAALSPHEKLTRSQWNIAEQKAARFGAREDELAALMTGILSGDPLTLLRGKTGSGKSTLMGRLALSLKEKDLDVIPISCGSTTELNDAMDILRYLVYALEERMSEEHIYDMAGKRDREEAVSTDLCDLWRERLADLIKRYAGPRLVVVIDAIDQLFADSMRENCVFLPAESSNKIVFAISCLDDCTLTLPVRQRCTGITLQDMTRQETVKAIHGILRYLGRELEERVIEVIADKPEAANPLYLSLLIQRLVMMDKRNFDAIARLGNDDAARQWHKIDIVYRMANTVEDACYDIVEEACRQIGSDFLLSSVLYLALSKNGLRERDLREILNKQGYCWNALDFSLLTNYLSSFFMMRDDGRIDFTHKTIRSGLCKHCKDPQTMHDNILLHLNDLEWDDPVSLDETVYQCVLADDREYFIWYVEDLVKDDYDLGLEPAAKQLYEAICQNGTEWLISLIKDTDETELGYEFFLFLFDHLSVHFMYDSEQYRTLIGILQEAAIRYAQTVGKAEERDRILLASMHLDIGGCFDYLLRYELAMEHYHQTIRLLEPISAQGHAEASLKLAKTYNLCGLLLSDQKRHRESLNYFLLAVKEFEKHEKSHSLAAVYHNISDYYDEQSEYEKALEFEVKALYVLNACDPDTREDAARDLILYYRRLALLYGRVNQVEKSLSYAEKAITLALHYAALRPQDFEEVLGYTYNDCAVVFADSTDAYHPKAVEYYKKAIAILEKYAASFPEEHEETLATAYTNLGVHCVRDPELLEQAAQAYVKGIAIKKRMYAEHPEAMGLWLATSYNYLGVVRLKQEKKGEVKRLFLSAVEAASVCEREELFLKRDTYALFHRNVAVACRETLQFKQAKQYERSADKIEACRTEAELGKYIKKAYASADRIGLRRDTITPKVVRFHNLFVLLFFLSMFGLAHAKESVQGIIIFIAILVSFVTGFRACRAASVEFSLTGEQKIILWALWWLSAGFAVGLYIKGFIKKEKSEDVRGEFAKRKKQRSVRTADSSSDSRILKKIRRMEKYAEQLKRMLSLATDETYCVRRNRKLFVGVLVNGLTVGFWVLTLVKSVFTLPGLVAVLAVFNLIAVAFLVKDFWYLHSVKTYLWFALTLLSVGFLSCVAVLILFYRDFHVKNKRFFGYYLLAFFTPNTMYADMSVWLAVIAIVFILCLIRRCRNPRIAYRSGEHPIAIRLKRQNEILHTYRMKLMH
ncbi:MAG: DUF4062 domain-containing protein [Clostridia bacterium]|nr:DUF4062 domain-containing protein [Clostridia bacterium]